jgi:hypothetical protein
MGGTGAPSRGFDLEPFKSAIKGYSFCNSLVSIKTYAEKWGTSIRGSPSPINSN